MEKILEEIRVLKAQQAATNNLIIEQGKQNAMILAILKELVKELQEKSNDQEDLVLGVMQRLDSVVGKLGELGDFIKK